MGLPEIGLRSRGGLAMKIRRLEIQGFKSFADRTVLKFGDGITGVVGPNGCGKSNIVDAIRWVMGEQSAKHLRGLGMQDIIFAGCETRGPAGMAEVSITFKNDGELVPPEYQQHEEIQVTRRLFRDGTSEYAINQVNCRLRDILDLFMGTGIGKNAYAIIEQGRIGLIVTARPEERRALIEDAAGVSRYKARRKQAERRIAATEQNLLRVTDIVTELQGRLKTLEGQAKKAEKYRRIKTELRELDLHSAAHKRLELDARELYESRRANDMQQTIGAEANAFDTEQTAIQEALETFSAEESKLRQQEAAAYENAKSLDLARQNLEFLLREEGKLKERVEEAELERSELLDEQSRLRTEQEEAEAIESSLDEGANEEDRELEAREVALEALKEQISSEKSSLDNDKTAMVEQLTAVAQRRNALENIARRAEDLTHRAETADEDALKANTRADEARKRLSQLEIDLAKKRQLKLQLEGEHSSRESQLDELRIESETVDGQLNNTRGDLLDRRSRLKSLQQIRSNYEGCSDAVRSVMQRGQDGLHGLVADLLTSDPRYETAVEAVLGERLQSIVVAEQQDGFDAGRFLRAEGNGRSTFVPLDLRLDHAPWAPRTLDRGGSSSIPPPSAAIPRNFDGGSSSIASTHAERLEGGAWPSLASEVAEVPTALPQPLEDTVPPPLPAGDTSAEELHHALTKVPGASSIPRFQGETISGLGDWMEEEDGFWPDLSDPLVCGRMVDLVRTKPGYEHVAHALIGDVVVVEGLDKAHELWVANGHRKTLVTLEGEVLCPMGLFTGGSSAGVSEGLLAQKREMEELGSQVTQLEQELLGYERRKKELRTQIGHAEAQLEALSAETQQGALAIVSFERDLASLREQITREGELSTRAKEDSNRLRADLEALSEEQASTEAALEELTQQKSDAEYRVSEAASALADLETQARTLTDSITTLKIEVAANREKRDSSKKNLVRITNRLDDIDTRLDRLSSVIERGRVEISEAQGKMQSERERIKTLEVLVERERTTLDQLRTELEGTRSQLKVRESALQKKRTVLDNVRNKLNKSEMKIREYQIARENLHAQMRDRYQIELDELLTDFHVLAPQSDEHTSQAKKLRRQLSDIGAINLTAIEEYAAVKARYDHLAEQKADLETAVEALKSAIRKINKTSQERFIEAFRLVNEKFQQVFPKVFAGGRSALVLTNEDEPLESGIEIMAQPPGKKLQSVNLLSGGEKALTAVSLIFGIFLIKPTPFCLLDEVDAPLDEANVGRYNDMLREMAHISQFVLITHNKRTMELPDRLYGVTMETPGVSKIVPVDVVSETDKRGGLRAV